MAMKELGGLGSRRNEDEYSINSSGSSISNDKTPHAETKCHCTQDEFITALRQEKGTPETREALTAIPSERRRDRNISPMSMLSPRPKKNPFSKDAFDFDLEGTEYDLDENKIATAKSSSIIKSDTAEKQSDPSPERLSTSSSFGDNSSFDNYDVEKTRGGTTEQHAPGPGLYIAPCMSLTHIHGVTTEILPYLLISTTGDGLLEDEDYLRNSNIAFVVNCCEKASAQGKKGHHLLEKKDFTLLYLNLKDESTQSLTAAFEEFFPIVEKAKSLGQKCLILCHSGMSRSVSLVLAYLLACEQMSLIDAFTHVKERRQMASPNPGFMAQLIQLEKRMRENVTVDLELYKNDRFADPQSFAVNISESCNEIFEESSSKTQVSGDGATTSLSFPIIDHNILEITKCTSSTTETPVESTTSHNRKLELQTPRTARSHKRTESDISITFNFSVDDVGRCKNGKDKFPKSRLQSDISIKFFNDGITTSGALQDKSHHSRSGSEMSFTFQQLPIQNMRSSLKDSSSVARGGTGEEDQGEQPQPKNNGKGHSPHHPLTSCGSATKKTVHFDECPSSSSFSVSRMRRLPPISQVGEPEDINDCAESTNEKESSQYFPLFQEVSSYVSSLLVCHATMDAADVTIKSPCVARHMKNSLTPLHQMEISVPDSMTTRMSAEREKPVAFSVAPDVETTAYDSLVTVSTSLSAMDEEESD